MISFGRIKINPLSLIYFAFVYIINPGDYFLLMILSVLIHEMGHMIAAKILKIKIEELNISPLGAKIKLANVLSSYSNDAVVYISGALANIAGGATALFLCRFYSDDRLIFFVFANIAYAVFNMLPITGLDGGGFLFSLLCKKKELHTAENIAGKTSLAFIVVFCFFSIFLISLMKFNLSLTVTLIFFLMTFIKKDKKIYFE